jgi:Skp family chaperone for outer membrane proteins
MKENEISIILDKKNIFIANSKYDITNSIIEILNNKIKD